MILFGERVLPEIGIVDIDAMIESSLSVERKREREQEREGGRERKFPEYLRNFNRKLIRDRRESASLGGAHCELHEMKGWTEVGK